MKLMLFKICFYFLIFDLIKVRVRMGCNCQKLEVHAKVCEKQLLRYEHACTATKISRNPTSVWDMFEKNIFLSVRFLWSTAWPADLMLIESTSK